MKNIILVENGPKECKEQFIQKLLSYEDFNLAILVNNGEFGGYNSWYSEYFPEDKVIRANFLKQNEVYEEIKRYRDAIGNLDGITTFMEEVVEITQIMQSRHQLPRISSGDPEILRDKSKMREAFKKHHLNQPECIVCSTLEEVKDAIKVVGYPCIIKPHKMFYSLGVADIYAPLSDQELNILFDKAMYSDFDEENLHAQLGIERKVIIETLMPKVEEVSVEGIVSQGEYLQASITGKFFGPPPLHEEIGYTSPRPDKFEPKVSDEMLSQIEETVRTGTEALKLENCNIHAELLLNPGDPPFIIEVGARVAGEKIPILLERATGQDLLRTMLKVSCGEKIKDQDLLAINAAYSSFMLIPDKSTMSDVRKFKAEISALPSFYEIVEYDCRINKEDKEEELVTGGGNIQLYHESAEQIAADRLILKKLINTGIADGNAGKSEHC